MELTRNCGAMLKIWILEIEAKVGILILASLFMHGILLGRYFMHEIRINIVYVSMHIGGILCRSPVLCDGEFPLCFVLESMR